MLVAYGVLKFSPTRCPSTKTFIKYFEVPKKEGTGRAIADGRLPNKCFQKPPPVNLPRIPDLLSEMALCNAENDVLLGACDSYDIMPDMVRLKNAEGKAIGVIALWYDNLVIATDTYALANSWRERVVQNALRFNSSGRAVLVM